MCYNLKYDFDRNSTCIFIFCKFGATLDTTNWLVFFFFAVPVCKLTMDVQITITATNEAHLFPQPIHRHLVVINIMISPGSTSHTVSKNI